MTDILLFLILLVNLAIFLQHTRWGQAISDIWYGKIVRGVGKLFRRDA